ncbi:hypothetical protein A2773_05025 [Candidatus Gottesmanbacteria bacterium RIFCSPHIGHO2_01_FULL_39_10]|uniref:Uncharacterized protein n=1 Tax=Candidatus Gottesmanbacteria bacterium RIFCSPHIGHO2_01_FULL_39_10 TaxID=1798375 RepID=A0A1F5ZSY5_9BACT|nr:MAG: hypothetical protein A2773_05025 [Candidatus Gottesmanbacteria bacterium RIFCSPHIGHO2_01_FULL_39_10]
MDKKESQTVLRQEKTLRSLDNTTVRKVPSKLIFIGLIVIIAGSIVGFVMAKRPQTTSEGTSSAIVPGSGKIVGSKDTSLFKDMAEGTLEKGGIDGEGTHHLVRPGGDSQTVYVTSTVMDLSPFVGKKIRVWGQTHAAQKAGWLMDVGRVETL